MLSSNQTFVNFLAVHHKNNKLLNIHGNQFTATLPDKLLISPDFKSKLIEFKVWKNPSREEGISLSTNQRKDWIEAGHITGGLNFWVLVVTDLRGDDGKGKFDFLKCSYMYYKLLQPENCQYLLNKLLYRELR